MSTAEHELRAVVRDMIRLLNDRDPKASLPTFMRNARAKLPYGEMFTHLRRRPGFRPGPDVVLLGLPRTGTSWLFWHLFESGRVVRTPYKEVNFLNQERRFSNRYFEQSEGRRNWTDYARQFVDQADQWIDAGMLELTILAFVHLLGPRNWRWYETVLGGMREQASLDLTPGNVKMPVHVARRLRRAYPHTRYAIFLRHPLHWAHSLINRSNCPAPVLVSHERIQSRTALSWARNAFRRPQAAAPSQPFEVGNLLFGRHLSRIARELGHVDMFLFEDLQRDPVDFMRSFSARYGLSIEPHAGMAAPIHEISERKAVTFTLESIQLLVDDLEGLTALVPTDMLGRWREDILKMRDAA